MEDLDQTIIERYLANDMSAAERIEIEQRAQQDPGFRKELEEYKHAVKAVRLSERDELRNRFKQRDINLDKQIKGTSSGRNIRTLMIVAIGILIALLAWKFLSPDNRETTPMQNDGRDTILVKEPGDVFAANFEPYSDGFMDPTRRGQETTLSPLEKFQLNYWTKKYPETIHSFKELTKAQQENDNLRFVYANALMATGNTLDAEPILAKITSNPQAIYRTEARLYLALSEIKNNKIAEARENLKAYRDQPESTQKELAEKLLAELE